MNIIQSPSPNYSHSAYPKTGVMIHKTLGLMPSTLEWLRNPNSSASSHYLITKGGDIHQLVQLDKRSWSAGRINNPTERGKSVLLTNWGVYVKPGHNLVQVEFECLLNDTYTEKQYEAIVWLCKNVFPFDTGAHNLVTHRDTAIDKPNLENERDEILKRLSSNNGSLNDEIRKKTDELVKLVNQLS